MNIVEADIKRCQWHIQDPVKNLWWSFCGNSTQLTGSSKQVHLAQVLNNKTLAQVFSSEFRKISKNTFFIEHLQTTGSVSPFLSLYSFLFFSYELHLPVSTCIFFRKWIIDYVFKLKTLITHLLCSPEAFFY